MTARIDINAKNSCNWRCCRDEPDIKKSEPVSQLPTVRSEVEIKTTQVYHRTHTTSNPITPVTDIAAPLSKKNIQFPKIKNEGSL